MARSILAILLCLVLFGCGEDTLIRRTGGDRPMFVATAMRLHPIFTRAKDFNGDGKIDGIEALLEFQDEFEDPVKAAGRAIFELYEYRKDSPDPRGKRLAGPWVGSLLTLDEQRSHWNRTSRTYSFELDYPAITAEQTVVLTAIFELSSGGRMFDRIVLSGKKPQTQETHRDEHHGPAGDEPGRRTPQP